jgi:CBS domain-containing protein
MLEMSMIEVGDVLRVKGTRIIIVRPRETVGMAATLMSKEDVHALVVKDVCRTEGNVVVGVFSERDVVSAVAARGAAALSLPVSTFLNRPLISCAASDTINVVLQLVDKHQVRLLPVLENHALIGVISIGDVIRYLGTTVTISTPADAENADSRHGAVSFAG